MKKKPAKPSRLTATPFPRKPTPIDRFADATRRDGLHALRQRCDALSARLGHVEKRLKQAEALLTQDGANIRTLDSRVGALINSQCQHFTRPSLWRRLARMWP